MATNLRVSLRAASAERIQIQATGVPIPDLVVDRSYNDNPRPNTESRPTHPSIGISTIKGLGVWGQSPQLYL